LGCPSPTSTLKPPTAFEQSPSLRPSAEIRSPDQATGGATVRKSRGLTLQTTGILLARRSKAHRFGHSGGNFGAGPKRLVVLTYPSEDLLVLWGALRRGFKWA
jgi:hypothetical protein